MTSAVEITFQHPTVECRRSLARGLDRCKSHAALRSNVCGQHLQYKPRRGSPKHCGFLCGVECAVLLAMSYRFSIRCILQNSLSDHSLRTPASFCTPASTASESRSLTPFSIVCVGFPLSCSAVRIFQALKSAASKALASLFSRNLGSRPNAFLWTRIRSPLSLSPFSK